MKGPLRRRDVRLIVAAVGASAAGDFILWVPLTLHLQAMTDSGIAVAALFIALWAPVVVLAPVAGLLVDRLEARGLLLVVSLLQAAVAGAMAFALDSEAAILALAALRLHARRQPQPAGDTLDRARDGVVYLFRDRTLALVLSVVFVSLLFMTASATAEVFFLREDLGVGDIVYGLVFTAWTMGMVAGALFVARRVPATAMGVGVLIAVAVQGAGLGLPTVWLVVPFGAAMWFVGGLGHGTKNVLARTLIQQRVPARLHGRAFAAYNGLRNGAEVVALAGGGVLVSAIGGRATLAIAGAVPVVAALVGLALFLRARARTPEPSLT